MEKIWCCMNFCRLRMCGLILNEWKRSVVQSMMHISGKRWLYPYVVGEYRVSENEAKRRILRRESLRRAFIRQSFHEDISDPFNYDLILNSRKLCIQYAVNAVIATIGATHRK